MIRKILNLKFVIRNCKAGMTYVEFIVVLSIFAALSSVILFNYGDFQDRVDIKNLASDIALKIVEAQKSSVNGTSPNYFTGDSKPAYGVYFDITTNNKQFIYFADVNNNYRYSSTDDNTLDTIDITKNNLIEKIESCADSACLSSTPISILSISFKRPDSSANFYNDTVKIDISGYIQITILSPKGATALIKIYPSGRVQVN